MLRQCFVFSCLLVCSASAFTAPRATLVVPSRQQIVQSLSSPIVLHESTAGEAPAGVLGYDMSNPDQGLEFTDTLFGEGETSAEVGNMVTVSYVGRLMENGLVFDQNADGISFKIGEGQVIKGWEQGIVGMKVGGKRKLQIPPSLAYGERGTGGKIPPNAHIEFDVELKNIASNPVEEFLATRQLEFPYVTVTIAVAVILLKFTGGGFGM